MGKPSKQNDDVPSEIFAAAKVEAITPKKVEEVKNDAGYVHAAAWLGVIPNGANFNVILKVGDKEEIVEFDQGISMCNQAVYATAGKLTRMALGIIPLKPKSDE